MKIRVSLYAQIFGMLFLYVLTIVSLVFLSFNARFGFGWDALVKSPMGDRVNTIADAITGQLNFTNTESWNEILKRYGRQHRVRFYVFDIFGHQLAGERVELPAVVLEKFPTFHLPPRIKESLRWSDYPRGNAQLPISDQEHLGEAADKKPYLNIQQFRDDKPPDLNFEPGWGPPRRDDSRDSPPSFPIPKELALAHGQFLVHSINPDDFWICTNIHFFPAHRRFPVPSVLLAETPNIWQSNMLFDSQLILQAAVALLSLSVAFWFPFVNSISRSLSKLTLATERIAEGHFDTTIAVNRADEIGRLSEAITSMALRLNNFVYGQKRFLGDISHELFSPIARLQMALELLAEGASESQFRHIQDVREEVQEMTSLVSELLAFSKAGLKGKDIQMTVLNPKRIVLDLLKQMNLIDKVTISQIDENCEVLGDPLLLSRALSNLLRNAVRYAGEAGPITVRSESDAKNVSLIISDSGPGVPDEALKYLTEPFFRPESSRSRSSGGVGLGLAIVKSCVESCGGAVFLRNRQEGGFEGEIRLNRA